MRTSFTLALACVPILVASCTSTRAPASPDRLASQILIAIEDGRQNDAFDLFNDVAESEVHRQRIYPVLYQAAQDYYMRGEAAESTALLRFMASEYPEATAVDEALLYSLFLLRATEEEASPALVAEMEEALDEVRSLPYVPLWVDLVATQSLIDRNRLADARLSFQRFAGSWDGQPESIAIFVEDIDRYLASH